MRYAFILIHCMKLEVNGCLVSLNLIFQLLGYILGLLEVLEKIGIMINFFFQAYKKKNSNTKKEIP